MFKHFWAFLTGDTVSDQADAFSTGDSLKRFIYSPQMIEEINGRRRYRIICNRAQTEIYVLDTLHRQRVGRFYDISYALIVADSLNQDTAEE